tara:strand:- start:1616 stop:2530 length:915 start_codon:yes stop_codon:yes gene_type:complete
MKNYKEKYIKYKLKYLNLNGGGQCGNKEYNMIKVIISFRLSKDIISEYSICVNHNSKVLDEINKLYNNELDLYEELKIKNVILDDMTIDENILFKELELKSEMRIIVELDEVIIINIVELYDEFYKGNRNEELNVIEVYKNDSIKKVINNEYGIDFNIKEKYKLKYIKFGEIEINDESSFKEHDIENDGILIVRLEEIRVSDIIEKTHELNKHISKEILWNAIEFHNGLMGLGIKEDNRNYVYRDELDNKKEYIEEIEHIKYIFWGALDLEEIPDILGIINKNKTILYLKATKKGILKSLKKDL